MNKIFSTALKTQIIIALGFVFLGFYTEADQLKVLEVKDGMATVKVPEGQTLSADQVLYTEQTATELEKGKRNSFATFYATPSYYFYHEDFSLLMDVGLGKIISLPSLVPDGILEGEMGFNGQFSYGGEEWGWGVDIELRTEINFIRNDGINKVIPGLRLGVGAGYDAFPQYEGPEIDINLAVYLKAFLHKQLAIIPTLKLSYIASYKAPIWIIPMSNANKARSEVDDPLKYDDILLGLGIGLRWYF